ncbi:MAG: hypothetical protein ACR5KV_01285 [Wolbachia sp.]
MNQKNENLREFTEKDEIKVFKVIKGHDIGNGRSAAILQLDGDLDTSKYYIAEYEDNEYLHCMNNGYDILLDYNDLFFVLNRSSFLNLKVASTQYLLLVAMLNISISRIGFSAIFQE